MPRPSDLETRRRLVEQLVLLEGDRRERERLLIEVTLRGGWARAAALYRPTPTPDGPRWSAVRARGPAELLPAADLVEGIAEGTISFEPPLGRAVLLAGEGSRRVALALGDHAGEEAVDELGALLEVLALLDPSPLAATLPSDPYHAPLPEAPHPREADDRSPEEPLGEGGLETER